jgi:DNA-directed RNA polymerase III subunit RPC1
MEMRDVLGIEAARKTIVDEIGVVMGDMDIDPGTCNCWPT